MKRYYADMSDMRDAGGIADDEFVLSSDYSALEAELAAEREDCPGGCAYWREAAKLLEQERDALREALARMVAIGYTHESGCHPSEGRHTEGCREKKAALAQAKAALAATEVKP